MNLCRVAYVTEYTKNLLSKAITGEVLLVHSSGAYLRFGTEVFLLCDQKWGRLPIGILVKDYPQIIHALHLEAGQQVLRKENQLIFQNGNIGLCVLPPSTETLCQKKPKYDAFLQAAEALAALQKKSGLSMLVLPLLLGKQCDPALWENPYFSRAYYGLDGCIKAIEQNDFDVLEENVQALLGLGTGLTPSADDIFMGMLYVFCRLHQGNFLGISMFQILIVKFSGTHTSQISAAYLKAILHGAPFDRMEQVYRGLCAEEPLNIEYLTQIGSNSGSEMLLGMLIAFYILLYYMPNEEE